MKPIGKGGNLSDVLKTLTSMGARHKDCFDNFSRPLADFLAKKSTKILHEIVPFIKTDAKKIMNILQAVDELPRSSHLNHRLMHTLLITAGPTDLTGILQNCILWKVIFNTRGTIKKDQELTPLNDLLRS
eukprot:1333300-Amorphochlora_amoeboformis.AAC.1